MGSGGAGTAELGIRLVASLAVVIGLLVLIARVAARRFKAPAGAAVQVVCRQSLTRGSGVAVVTVGTRVLVLGTTEQQVTLLAEVEPDEVGLDLVDEESAANHRPAGDSPGLTGIAARVNPRKAPVKVDGPLAGSLLSPQTWRDTLAVFTGGKDEPQEAAPTAASPAIPRTPDGRFAKRKTTATEREAS